MENQFNIHWIVDGKHIYLPKNNLYQLPRVGDEIRQSDETFYKVKKIVWCLDEPLTYGQRVNIGLTKVHL